MHVTDAEAPATRPWAWTALATLPALVLLSAMAWSESREHRTLASPLRALPHAAVLRWSAEGLAVVLLLGASLALASLLHERRLQRQRLRELDRLSNGLFDTVGALLMVLDRQGSIVRFNQAAQDFMGYTFDEVRGRPFFWTRFLSSDCQARVLSVFERLFDGTDIAHYENPWISRSGEPRMFEWRNTVLRDADGRPRYLITLGVDVTDSRRARTRLADSEARYRNLVESAPDAVFVDRGGHFALVNRACVRLLGAAGPEELLGRVVLDFVAPDSRQRVAEQARSLLEQGGTAPALQARVLRLDGVEVEVEGVATAFEFDGEPARHVILHDLTERRRLEREVIEIATAEQERIGREIHDGLGQQLTALGLMCTALQRRLTRGDGAADAVEGLRRQIQTATAEARTLARGLAPIRLDGGSLCTALRTLVDTIAAAGVECQLEVRGAAAELDEAVATHLYRITQEALNNAVKHARAQRIEVEVDWSAEQISVAVRDDGIGLPAQRRDNLGMPIMRHRASLIGACLQVESAAGGGTVVSCSWARAPGARPG